MIDWSVFPSSILRGGGQNYIKTLGLGLSLEKPQYSHWRSHPITLGSDTIAIYSLSLSFIKDFKMSKVEKFSTIEKCCIWHNL